nr:MAG TPA: hypothetical protein [Bacteriophage sp.]
MALRFRVVMFLVSIVRFDGVILPKLDNKARKTNLRKKIFLHKFDFAQVKFLLHAILAAKNRLTGGVKSWSNVVNPRSCGFCAGLRGVVLHPGQIFRQEKTPRGAGLEVWESGLGGKLRNHIRQLLRGVAYFTFQVLAAQQIVGFVYQVIGHARFLPVITFGIIDK